MKILYISSRGVNDPTGATLALHLAANGSVEVGQDVAVVLAGDATLLARKETADAVTGSRSHRPPTCSRSSPSTRFPSTSERHARSPGATDEDLAWMNGRWASPPDVAQLVAEHDRVVTL